MYSQKFKQIKIYLLSLTNTNLKEICKTLKIKGFSDLKKEELIDLITKSIPKTNLEFFFHEMEKKSLLAILSLVPRYFSEDELTKIDRMDFDNQNSILRLRFKGFTWEVITKIQFQNLIDEKEPLIFDFNCTCNYSKAGGLCSHFWTGLVYIFQRFSIATSRWNRTSLPANFNELIKEINFNPYIKQKSIIEKINIQAIETFLKENLMGKTDFIYEDLEDLSINQILSFISSTKIELSVEEGKKHKKKELVEIIKDQMEFEEFNKRFFRFRKDSRISDAKKIRVYVNYIKWGPPLNCSAKLIELEDKIEKIVEINIENNQIKHTDCHWIYHRKNFCRHLIALLLNLFSKESTKTLEFLKSYITRY